MNNQPYHTLSKPGTLLIMKAVQVVAKENRINFDLETAICYESTPARSLPATLKEGQNRLATLLSTHKSLSITLDHWKETKKNLYYLGFTVSYVDLTRNQIMTRLLHIADVPDKKDPTTNSAWTQVKNLFNIENKKFFYTTDNALQSLFKNHLNYDDWNSCFGHNMALFLKHTFYNDDPAKLRFLPNLRATVRLGFNKDDFSSKAIDIFLIMHGTSIIEGHLNILGQLELMKIVQLIYNCKKLVTNVKQSNNGLQNKLIQEVVTRWDTIYDMLQSIFKSKSLLRATASQKDKEKLKYPKLNELLNFIDFKLLFQFKTYLRMFKTARLNMSYRFKPTLYRVINYTCFLHDRIADEDCPLFLNSSHFICEIFEAKILCKINVHHKLAAAMSPFGLNSWKQQSFRCYSVSDQIQIEGLLSSYENLISTDSKPGIEEQRPTSEKKAKYDPMSVPFDKRMLTTQPARINESKHTLIDEFKQYMIELDDNIQFVSTEVDSYEYSKNETLIHSYEDLIRIWIKLKPKYPKLYEIAILYMPIQATNVASESIFSSSNYMITDQANRIAPATL
jgi:hypothetical protein